MTCPLSIAKTLCRGQVHGRYEQYAVRVRRDTYFSFSLPRRRVRDCSGRVYQLVRRKRELGVVVFVSLVARLGSRLRQRYPRDATTRPTGKRSGESGFSSPRRTRLLRRRRRLNDDAVFAHAAHRLGRNSYDTYFDEFRQADSPVGREGQWLRGTLETVLVA